MAKNGEKLFQARDANCKDCTRLTFERAQAEGGKDVAPIFYGAHVEGAEWVACAKHQQAAGA